VQGGHGAGVLVGQLLLGGQQPGAELVQPAVGLGAAGLDGCGQPGGQLQQAVHRLLGPCGFGRQGLRLGRALPQQLVELCHG
jgi:hypothetical protein